MKTPIVTLTTDWGNQGFFAGMVKGALYSMVEGVQVVDIAHHIEPFNKLSASFVVMHACMGFPPGTVHIIDIASTQPFLAVKARDQYFLCCDNGIPYMAFGDQVQEAINIPLQQNGVYNFAAYSLFTRVASQLLHGAPLSDIGPRLSQLTPSTMTGWIPQGDQYRINILYVDSYGNAYLGMSYSQFEQLRQGRRFAVTVRDYEVTEVSSSYHHQQQNVQPSRPYQRQPLKLTVSATGMLELTMTESSFSQLLGLHARDSVLLRFKD